MSELNWTGERLVTQLTDRFGTVEHLHRYALAIQLVTNKVVLDIAAGEGYGANLLSLTAKEVYGVDISVESVTHANAKYKKSNLHFMVGTTSNIPLADASVDVVTSFETIEHHNEHTEMMAEIKRVLKPLGVLLISSPDKNNYKFREPNNPYHIKELTTIEFEGLLNGFFKHYKIFNQRFIYGSVISRSSHQDQSAGFNFFSGNYAAITDTLNEVDEKHADNVHNRPYFNIALASDSDINDIPFSDSSIFDAAEVYHKQIEAVRNSNSFKLGNFLLRPLSFLKALKAKFNR